MGENDVWQGTLALMILKTLESMGSLHGYGIARRIEQVSGDKLVVQYGTLYPALLRLEQEGYISSEWGLSTTIAGRASTSSPGPDAGKWKKNRGAGKKRQRL